MILAMCSELQRLVDLPGAPLLQPDAASFFSFSPMAPVILKAPYIASRAKQTAPRPSRTSTSCSTLRAILTFMESLARLDLSVGPVRPLDAAHHLSCAVRAVPVRKRLPGPNIRSLILLEGTAAKHLCLA